MLQPQPQPVNLGRSELSARPFTNLNELLREKAGAAVGDNHLNKSGPWRSQLARNSPPRVSRLCGIIQEIGDRSSKMMGIGIKKKVIFILIVKLEEDIFGAGVLETLLSQ